MLILADLGLCLFAFFIGSVFGSFLNVLIYRIPRGIGFIKGRSKCTSCGKALMPYEMLPVISYAFLRGRCRSCKMKISVRYPIVETIAGLIALLVYIKNSITISSLIVFAFLCVLIAVAFIDLDTMTIPDGLIISLAVFAAFAAFFIMEPDIISRFIGAIGASFPMLFLTLVIPESFGGGDIKLIAVCGFMLGWRLLLPAVFFALLFGGIHGAILLAIDKRNGKKHFAFGQYICLGTSIALLYGEPIIQWYLNIFSLKY